MSLARYRCALSAYLERIFLRGGTIRGDIYVKRNELRDSDISLTGGYGGPIIVARINPMDRYREREVLSRVAWGILTSNFLVGPWRLGRKKKSRDVGMLSWR